MESRSCYETVGPANTDALTEHSNATEERPVFWVDHGQHGSDALLSDYFRIADNTFAMDRQGCMVRLSPNLRGSEEHATATLATGRT